MSDQAKLSAQPQSLYARALDHEIDTAASFEALFARERYAFWLDSAPGSDGRYSLLGAATNVLTGGFDGGFDELERAVRARRERVPAELPAELPLTVPTFPVACGSRFADQT